LIVAGAVIAVVVVAVVVVVPARAQVTEAEMAIAMARNGGIGIIHRYLSVEEQAHTLKPTQAPLWEQIDHAHTQTGFC
jgi:hypothetical protein